MYTRLVLLFGFALLLILGFFIYRADASKVIFSSFYDPSKRIGVSVATSSLFGSYVCDINSGCRDPYKLTLSDFYVATLVSSPDAGVTLKTTNGIWGLDQSGSIVVSLSGVPGEYVPGSNSFSIFSFSPAQLSHIIFDVKNFDDWRRPVFKRETNNGQSF